MAQDGNQWNILSTIHLGNGILDSTTYALKIIGDTTFNNQTYSKLYKSEDALGEDFQPIGVYIRQNDFGKVFITGGTSEKLLYNFRLYKDDHVENQNNYITTVETIDTIIDLKGQSRKFYDINIDQFETSSQALWIEGIGNVSNPLHPLGHPLIRVLCFYQNDELVYQSSQNSCYFNTVTNTKESISNQNITITPNPTNDYFSIDGLNGNIESAKLFNANGQMVKEYRAFDALYSVKNMQSGLYFLKIKTKNGISVQKLFIAK